MEPELRDRISRLVRGIVIEVYGELTCAATVKVLSEVLLTGWEIKLIPHVVSLKIVPPKVVEIIERSDLTNQQKLELVGQLPNGEQSKTLESSEDERKFHMVGLSGCGDKCILWDPSIDQVNINFDTCRLNPLSLPMSTSRPDANGNIIFAHEGCHLIYKEQTELEKRVFASEVWLTGYSELSKKALKSLF